MFTFTDRATKMVHLVKARATDDALQIAQQLLYNILRLHGLPRSLLSDRDPRLMSEIWRQLCILVNVKRSNTRGVYPQANGRIKTSSKFSAWPSLNTKIGFEPFPPLRCQSTEL